MPLPDRAQANSDFRAACDALRAIMADRNATAAEKLRARSEIDRLTNEFIGKAEQRLEARTAQYQEFIDNMRDVLAFLEDSSAADGIATLTAIVNAGEEALA